MSKRNVGIGAGTLAAVGAVILTLAIVSSGNGDPVDAIAFFVDDARILQLVPAGYDVDEDGHLLTPAGDRASPHRGELAEATPEAIEAYREALGENNEAWSDYEDAVLEKLREIAVAALVADGVNEPPARPKLYLVDGGVTDVKP